MRICVVGTSCVGKTTFINDFLKKYPMYKLSKESYRDILDEKGVKLNREGNQESQEIIRDYMSDQALKYNRNSNVVFDRCILDNLIYSVYLNDKDPENISDAFIHKSLQICREVCKFYDIIFFLPITKHSNIPVEERQNRDIDEDYRNEIDMLFKAAVHTYRMGKSVFFDMTDTPAIIEIFGSPEERVAMAELYIDPKTGDIYGPEHNLLAT
jgi:predicted ATPase